MCTKLAKNGRATALTTSTTPPVGPFQPTAAAASADGHGLAALHQGKLAEAADQFRLALRLQAHFPEASYHLGYTLSCQGQLDEAIAAYRQALRGRPDFAEVHNNLGMALRQQRRAAEAEASCREAVRLLPQSAEVHINLGMALLDLNRPGEALDSLRRAVQLQPNAAPAHHHLGCALHRLGRLEEAAVSLQEAVRLQPTLGDAWTHLGSVLRALDRLDEALARFVQALRLNPGHVEAYLGLGNVLRDQDRIAEAITAYRTALQLKPDCAQAHANLGVALLDEHRLPESLACAQRALQLEPENILFHWNRAVLWLLSGDFEQGLPEHEWRIRGASATAHHTERPRWDGSPLAGRTILLYADAALGDTIQFVRYARLAREQGARVIVECQRPLLRLLSRCPGIDQLVGRGDPLPAHDVQVQLMSLPHFFRTRLDTIPADIPYLKADPALVEQWRGELAALPGFKIGIVWRGSQRGARERCSIPLAEFAPLAELEGVHLVSLQKGPGSEQLAAVAERWPVTDLGPRLDETAGAFMDTAAVLQHLDLVVTCDTSMAHLAGALGVPVWVALSKVPYWCFLLGRDDCPWYPTMRLFRQERLSDWDAVLRRIAQAVQQRLRSGVASNHQPVREPGSS